MKIRSVLACLTLIILVKGNLLAAAFRGGIEPIILSLGTAFALFDGIKDKINVDSIEPVDDVKLKRYQDW